MKLPMESATSSCYIILIAHMIWPISLKSFTAIKSSIAIMLCNFLCSFAGIILEITVYNERIFWQEKTTSQCIGIYLMQNIKAKHQKVIHLYVMRHLGFLIVVNIYDTDKSVNFNVFCEQTKSGKQLF